MNLFAYIEDSETTTEDQYTTVTVPDNIIETTMVTKNDINAASETLYYWWRCNFGYLCYLLLVGWGQVEGPQLHVHPSSFQTNKSLRNMHPP